MASIAAGQGPREVALSTVPLIFLARRADEARRRGLTLVGSDGSFAPEPASDEDASGLSSQLALLDSQVQTLSSLIRMAAEVSKLLESFRALEDGTGERRAVFPGPEGSHGPMVVELLSSLQQSATDAGEIQRETLVKLLALAGETGVGLVGVAQALATELNRGSRKALQHGPEPGSGTHFCPASDLLPACSPPSDLDTEQSCAVQASARSLDGWVHELARQLLVAAG